MGLLHFILATIQKAPSFHYYIYSELLCSIGITSLGTQIKKTLSFSRFFFPPEFKLKIKKKEVKVDKIICAASDNRTILLHTI